MIFELDTEFPWGKHEGQTLAWVLDNDPSYIVWLHRSTNHQIDKEALELAYLTAGDEPQ